MTRHLSLCSVELHMTSHPACSPFAARISVGVEFRGELYQVSALPLEGEIAGFRFWEVFVARFDRVKIFVVSQPRRSMFGLRELVEHAVGFVSDGRF